MLQPVGKAPRASQVAVWLLGCALPVAIGLAGALAITAWRADLPAMVAIHWGEQGPDAFASRAVAGPVGWGIVAAIAVVGAVGCWWSLREGQAGITRRMVVAVSVFLATTWQGVWAGSLSVQRGLAQASAAPSITPVFVAVLAAAIGFGVTAGLALPREGERHGNGRETFAERITNVAPLWGVAGAAAICLAVALSSRLGWWALALMTLIVAAMLVAGAQASSALVTIDERGLIVTAGFGAAAQCVPLNEVEAVHIVNVSPLRDFGGWGTRTALDGRSGVVMRAGPAIEVERAGGRRFVVSLRGAARAATLLATLASRHRTP